MIMTQVKQIKLKKMKKIDLMKKNIFHYIIFFFRSFTNFLYHNYKNI